MRNSLPHRLACGLLLLAAGVPAVLAQQNADPLTLGATPFNGIPEMTGFHIYGVSVYTGYTSMAGPGYAAGASFVPGMQGIGGDTNYGAQWLLGWRHEGLTTASANYTGSYDGQSRYSNLNAFGHSLALDVSRQITPKWTVRVSANGQYMTAAQYLYQPSSAGLLYQLPGDPSLTLGSITDPTIAAILAPWMVNSMVATPARSLLLGDRILTYGIQSSLTYSPSTRWTFTFSSVGAGGQSAIDSRQTYVVPRTISLNVGVSAGYQLSPRTTIGFNISENRATNQFQAAYDTNASANFSRKMGLHWFVSGNAGMGFIKPIKQLFGTPPSREVIGGGSIGYRLFTQTFVASYNRSTFDTGIAAGLSAQAMGAWAWHRPSASWTLNASGGQQQIRDAGFTGLSAWRGTIGFTRNLGSQVAITTEYAYLDTTGTYLGIRAHRQIHTVRLSMGWGPGLVAR